MNCVFKENVGILLLSKLSLVSYCRRSIKSILTQASDSSFHFVHQFVVFVSLVFVFVVFVCVVFVLLVFVFIVFVCVVFVFLVFVFLC